MLHSVLPFFAQKSVRGGVRANRLNLNCSVVHLSPPRLSLEDTEFSYRRRHCERSEAIQYLGLVFLDCCARNDEQAMRGAIWVKS